MIMIVKALRSNVKREWAVFVLMAFVKVGT
jgi:hypothetical protein